MAEEETEQEGQEEPVDEAAELQRMLGEAEEAEAADVDIVGKLKAKLQDKKVLIPAIAVLILLIAGGVYWFLNSGPDVPEEELVEPGVEEEAPPEEEDVEEVSQFKRINVYPLESFFIPLELANPDLGQFVSLKVAFVLSNRKLDREIDKNIGEIRKQIYDILRRKKSIAYIENRVKIKERLKQEIVTASNSLLASGAGTISDVLFTDFVIK